MADRVALMAVQHHLRLGGGAGGEVQQHRVGGQCAAKGFELLGVLAGGAVRGPVGGGRADADAAAAFGKTGKLVHMRTADHQVANLATLDAVAQVIGGQQGGGGDDHGAEFERGQHGLPQGNVVTEHQQDAITATHAQGTQVIGHLVGARGQLLEAVALFAAVLFNYPQGTRLVALGHGIKVVQCPVELAQLRPAEVAHGRGVVGTVGEQEVASGKKGLAVAIHWGLHRSRVRGNQPARGLEQWTAMRARRGRVPDGEETEACRDGFTLGALVCFYRDWPGS
ncbi:hypothetical protein D9M71_191910 [compost metagenome]